MCDRFGGHAGTVFASMRSHRLLVEVERDQRVAGVQFQCSRPRTDVEPSSDAAGTARGSRY